MNCPGCGAPATQESLDAGECGYCHTALVVPKVEAPKIVNVTRVEIHAPDVGNVAGVAGGVFDSISARMFGCLSGCVSIGMTVGIMALVFGFVAYQLWITTKSMPSPASPPAAHAPRRR